jgi:AcrR family transcriptional regulator
MFTLVSNVQQMQGKPSSFAQVLERIVPDANAALSGLSEGETAIAGALWQRQRQREAEILRQARILVGQSGHSAFSIRKVADNCGLAPQTVYNLVGDREQLLEAAIGQHVSAMIAAARLLEGPPTFFLAFAEVLWGHALKNPTYVKTVTRGQLGIRSIPARSVKAILTGAFQSELAQLANSGALRKNVDIVFLAERMLSLLLTTAIGWVEAGRDTTALRQQLVAGLGLLLLGAMKASARGPIEEWTDAVQTLSGMNPARSISPGIAICC